LHYLILLFGALMCSLQFTVTKRYEKHAGQSFRAAMLFTLISAAFGAALMFTLNRFRLDFTPFSCVMAVFMALGIMLVNVLGMKTMHLGPLSVYTLFMMLGGMFLPFVMGVLFLDERLNVFKVAGAALIVLALIIPAIGPKGGGKKGSALFYLLCVLLFFINGSYSCVSKLHQIGENAVNTYSLMLMIYLFEIAAAAVSLLVTMKKGRGEPLKKDGGSVLYSAGFALFSGVCGLCVISSAKSVSASVMFPIVTGGTIIFSALCGRIMFKEKLSKPVVIEVALAVAATVMFMF